MYRLALTLSPRRQWYAPPGAARKMVIVGASVFAPVFVVVFLRVVVFVAMSLLLCV